MVRIYLQLSAPPPYGWSYLFTGIWQATDYPAKCQAGADGDAIWIECVPDEVRQVHLPELEKAVSQTNSDFRGMMRQRASDQRRRAELDERTRSQLAELVGSFQPNQEPDAARRETRRSSSDAFLAFMRGVLSRFGRAFGIRN